MDFHRIEKVAPFIRRVGSESDGSRHRVDRITLFIQRQSDGCGRCAGRRDLQGATELRKILFDSLTLIGRKRPRSGVAKGVQ
ncbi:hypothetical protein MS6016_33280 [Klebsiella variicola]|nr:hypothetical protein MS6016_33280 [Klebsiella variicola]